MNNARLDPTNIRTYKARLAAHGAHLFMACAWLSGLLALIGFILLFTPVHYMAFPIWSIALASFMPAAWYYGDLKPLPVAGDDLTGRIAGDVLQIIQHNQPITPQSLWHTLQSNWQSRFFTNHLLLPYDEVERSLSQTEADMALIWADAVRLADTAGSKSIEAGHIAAALLRSSPTVNTLLTQRASPAADIIETLAWLQRILTELHAPKPSFGGVGRDWANGFTPQLNRYGENVSLAIERYGSHYSWLMSSPGVSAMKSSFSQGASAIALIGNEGIGKTSHVYALAQSLLQEAQDRNLEHRQIISLNPSLILSSGGRTGDIEHTIVTLLDETIRAGHIILFLDDAQLFFSNGIGTFDITRILLPIVQHRAIQIIMAMTPHDYQQLKINNSAFASLVTPVTLSEPDESDVMRILEDTALGLEHRHKVLIALETLREAYRLSNRYEQDIAMPGKAILLLEQSLSHAYGNIVTANSVQLTLEQTRGVKAGAAAPAEAEQLLHLEEAIHNRMVNQSRAVSVVANALRRARAGVANPKRPIGSFLFLGPTGVGKTELAKAIAATYFGDESNMIRLDMSEYQQASDVNRLLSSGTTEKTSLIMAVRQQPFSVVLLDEIEKAHPNILNLLLQLLDEGQLTDISGRMASFKDTVVIATSNAGAVEIRERIERGEELASFERQFIDSLINQGQFKPELLNRFDEIVLFRPLKAEELAQVVHLMLKEVNATLANQRISVELTDAATQKIVAAGYDPRFGARPMRRELQRAVEDSIASRILSGHTKPGDHVVLDANDLATQQAND